MKPHEQQLTKEGVYCIEGSIRQMKNKILYV